MSELTVLVDNPSFLKPRKVIRRAHQRISVQRDQLESFRKGILSLRRHLRDAATEEAAKTHVRDFLTGTLYPADRYYVNTQGRMDMVICNGPRATDHVAVIIEAKRAANRAEMPTPEAPNVKGLHELLSYYLAAREAGNRYITHLVATDGNKWFVSDENWWRHNAYGDRALMELYRRERELNRSTQDFYTQVAKPFFDRAGIPPFVWVTLPTGENLHDEGLVDLYRLLSPTHLLKQPLANDSNTLDRDFYEELLYLIGLEEVSEGGQKKIQRLPKGQRQPASLIENAVYHLGLQGKIPSPNPTSPDSHHDDPYFEAALELSLTWINRILFLKLLEGQLIRYRPDAQMAFLTPAILPEYDEVHNLFFGVLNRPPEHRDPALTELLGHVPYLNSMLFEPSQLEVDTIGISGLRDRIPLPLHPRTVLRDPDGARRVGALQPLTYLLEFLGAYDFGAEADGQIQIRSKTLINASVLGLIFEKINGYRDGAFFTPGYITEHMCRQAIRPAALDALNRAFGWQCETLKEFGDRLDYFKPEERKKANDALEGLRLCDPAVGSGHFLVSALNELVALKGELRIWEDVDGRPINGYRLDVENDELVVTRKDDDTLFRYRLNPSGRPVDDDDQRVQQSLFCIKRDLIENCLYGVDINPKSAAICRLRLWIELLKHAYYTPESQYRYLQTLPNLDINIGVGNSLISQFGLRGFQAGTQQQRNTLKRKIVDLKVQIGFYRAAKGKDEKDKIRRIMQGIRDELEKFAPVNDPVRKKWKDLNDRIDKLGSEIQFGSDSQGSLLLRKLTEEQKQAAAAWEARQSLYRQAFEWRFAFPGMLDDEGDFMGFDIIVGNPPYIRQEQLGPGAKELLKLNYKTFAGTADLYVYFVELGMELLRDGGQFHYILPNKWMRAGYGRALRLWAAQWQSVALVDFGDLPVFESATTYPALWHIRKEPRATPMQAATVATLDFVREKLTLDTYLTDRWQPATEGALTGESWSIATGGVHRILGLMREAGTPLGEYVDGRIYRGVLTGLNKAFVIDRPTRDRLIDADPGSADVIKPFLAGRDIKRYQTPTAERWLILLPKGATLQGMGVTRIQPMADAEGWLASTYPALHAWLKPHEAAAIARADQGDYWWELRACDYYPLFEQPKIMLPDIAIQSEALYDTQELYTINTAYIIPKVEIELLGLMNSSATLFYYQNITSSIRGGYLRFIRQYLASIPVPQHLNTLSEVTRKVIRLKSLGADTTLIERDIDHLVYELYGFTPADIALIEGAS